METTKERTKGVLAMSLAGVGSVVKLTVRRTGGQVVELSVRLGDATELPPPPESEPAP